MIHLKHILVPTDFGEASEAALTYGRALAASFGADLTLLHVTENLFFRPMVTDPVTLRAGMIKRLRDRLTPADLKVLHARAILEISDDPADEIVTYAKSANIDLIVMGTHGRRGAAHLLMGSVAERVVRTASCPVFTVRHPEREFVVADRQEQLAAART